MALDLSQFGGYNDFPPGWRQITDAEFARKMTLYSFDHQEHRQMHAKDAHYTESAMKGRLFFFWDGTGVAVVSKSVRDETKGFGYKDVAEFYAFGCDHEYESIAWDRETMGPQFRCNHASKCKKCGQVWVVDSSD